MVSMTVMKRLILIGILLTVLASPCWGSGKDDYSAAANKWETGDQAGALPLYQNAIDSGELTGDDLASAHYHSAIAYFLSSRFSRAMTQIDKVIEMRPKDVSAIELRANIWLELGAVEQRDTGANALADWERVLSLNPADANTFYDRAMFYAEKGEFAKAVADLEKFLSLEPDNPEQVNLLKQLKDYLRESQKTNKKPEK